MANITKYTVQEILNRKSNFEEYASVTGDDNDWNADFEQISTSTDWESDEGSATSPFADTTKKWSKVSVHEQAGSIHLYIKLNNAANPIIYVPAGNLPITFSGYDITDMWIKTSGANAQVNIIAWR